MRIQIDAYRGSLVLRFAVNRKTYRYNTGVKMTDEEWIKEQKSGYKRSGKAIEAEDKAKEFFAQSGTDNFNIEDFRKQMGGEVLSKDAISVWMGRYLEFRSRARIAIKTRRMDESMKVSLDAFLKKNPKYDNAHVWTAETLDEFTQFMLDEEKSATTARIYLVTLRTFFNWLVNDKEVLLRSPYRKFKLPTSKNHWAPYDEEEVKVILALKSKNDSEREAKAWVKMFIYSGGVDPKDFAEMKWRQVRKNEVQIIRTKTRSSSKSSEKLLYFTDSIKELFNDLKSAKGSPDDFVFGIYDKSDNEERRAEKLSQHIKSINTGIQSMLDRLEENHIEFTIKRLRPTAAMISQDASGDVNVTSKMLMHSELGQTGTYLKRIPDAKVKKSQEAYENMIKKISS